MSAKINVNKLAEELHTKHLGKSIIFSSAVGSTNDLAKELAILGAQDGTVVIAETQTHGRGRLNRKWVSPRGGLWLSLVLRPKLKPAEASRLVFVCGLAVAETLHQLYDLRVETKWPNDVLANGKKVCGILAEMNTKGEKLNYVILGIGINANFKVEILPEQLLENATSLKTELRTRISLEQLLKTLLEKLENAYALLMNQGFDPILKEWKKYASFLGSQVEVTTTTEKWKGTAFDVDNDGSLMLKLRDETTRRVMAGDIQIHPNKHETNSH